MEEKKNRKITMFLIILVIMLITYTTLSEIENKNYFRELFIKNKETNFNNNTNTNNEKEDNNENNQTNLDFTIKHGKTNSIYIKDITKNEINKIIENLNASCGVKEMYEEGEKVSCQQMWTNNQIGFIKEDTAYFATTKNICDNNGECTTDEETYEVFKLLDNVQNINTNYTQKARGIAIIALKNKELYFFTLSDDYNIIKVQTELSFKEFVKNIENDSITFGTDTIIKMYDNNLYTIEYDPNNETAKLKKYSE